MVEGNGSTDTNKVQDFALHDKIVEAVDDLLDAGIVIPPVNVQNVDVVRTQLLQGRLHGDVERLHIVTREAGVLLDVLSTALEVAGILR